MNRRQLLVVVAAAIAGAAGLVSVAQGQAGRVITRKRTFEASGTVRATLGRRPPTPLKPS
jgi:hypothetical protein